MPSKTLAEKLIELIQAPVTDENREQNNKDMGDLFAAVKILSENPRLVSASIDTTVVTRINTSIDPNKENFWSFDLLGLAIYFDKEVALRGLLDEVKIPVDKIQNQVTALWMSVAFKRPHFIALLLTRGADINFTSLGQRQHATALHVAAMDKNYGAAYELLLGGADPTIKSPQDGKQFTALDNVSGEKEGEGERVKKVILAAQSIQSAIVESQKPSGMISSGQKIDTAFMNDQSFTFEYLTLIANECARVSRSTEGGMSDPKFYHPALLKLVLPKITMYIEQGLLDHCDEKDLKLLIALGNAIETYNVKNALPKEQQIFAKPEKQKDCVEALYSAKGALEALQKQAQVAEEQKVREEAEAAKLAEEKAARDTQEAAEKAANDAAKASTLSVVTDGATGSSERPSSPSSSHAQIATVLALGIPPLPPVPVSPVGASIGAILAASFKPVFAATEPASPTPDAKSAAAAVQSSADAPRPPLTP
jgi:hypothetical protein